jgi:ABC-type phosphate transport system substrate-binding protein
MTISRGAHALATAALLLAAVSACAGDGNSSPTSPISPTPSTQDSTGSTTPPPTEAELASEAASAVLRKYYEVRNDLRQHPNVPLKRLGAVAISSELSAQRLLVKKEREAGHRQVGDTKVAQFKVQSVNLDNSDPTAGKVPTVQIDVCADVSDVDFVDAGDNSIISSDRPDSGWIRFLVSNYEWDSDPDGGWRVASSQDLEREPCDVS